MAVSMKLHSNQEVSTIRASVNEAGWSGATIKLFTNPKGLSSMVATISDVMGYVITNPVTGVISSQCRYVGAAIGAFPEAISELASGVPALFGSGRGSKAYASTLKGLAGVASVGPTLVKMNIINLSASVISRCSVAKSLLEVAHHVSNCFYQFVAKPREIDSSLRSAQTPWVKDASKELRNERIAAQVKAIVGLTFFSFLALGTVFGMALAPLAITSLGTLYMFTIIAVIYTDTFKGDALGRAQASYWNDKVVTTT
jgi:hypothetical protein